MDNKRARILMVDDDVDFVDLTRGVLETAGHTVLTASTGSEGLKKARAERPDLMLLDVMMESTTEGLTVSRQIRRTRELQGMPVILLTGLVGAMELRSGLKPDRTWLPVSAVIEKPVAPSRLLEEIRKHLPAGRAGG